MGKKKILKIICSMLDFCTYLHNYIKYSFIFTKHRKDKHKTNGSGYLRGLGKWNRRDRKGNCLNIRFYIALDFESC